MAVTISGTTGVSLADEDSVATAAIQDGAVTPEKLSGEQSGSAPIYGCRAWAVFNGTTTGTNPPTAGGNVTSITRNGTGDYTITFTVAMQDADYCVQLTGGSSGVRVNTFGVVASNLAVPTTTNVRVKFFDDQSTVIDESRIQIAVFR